MAKSHVKREVYSPENHELMLEMKEIIYHPETYSKDASIKDKRYALSIANLGFKQAISYADTHYALMSGDILRQIGVNESLAAERKINRLIGRLEERKKYYPELKGTYDNQIEVLRSRIKRKASNLEKVSVTACLLFLSLSVVFMFPTITGNAITNLGGKFELFSSFLLFLAGLLLGIYYLFRN